jgi:hypothetical protein
VRIPRGARFGASLARARQCVAGEGGLKAGKAEPGRGAPLPLARLDSRFCRRAGAPERPASLEGRPSRQPVRPSAGPMAGCATGRARLRGRASTAGDPLARGRSARCQPDNPRTRPTRSASPARPPLRGGTASPSTGETCAYRSAEAPSDGRTPASLLVAGIIPVSFRYRWRARRALCRHRWDISRYRRRACFAGVD